MKINRNNCQEIHKYKHCLKQYYNKKFQKTKEKR